MLAKQARKIQASECGANMLLLAARRTVVGSARSVMLPSSFSGRAGACSYGPLKLAMVGLETMVF